MRSPAGGGGRGPSLSRQARGAPGVPGSVPAGWHAQGWADGRRVNVVPS